MRIPESNIQRSYAKGVPSLAPKIIPIWSSGCTGNVNRCILLLLRQDRACQQRCPPHCLRLILVSLVDYVVGSHEAGSIRSEIQSFIIGICDVIFLVGLFLLHYNSIILCLMDWLKVSLPFAFGQEFSARALTLVGWRGTACIRCVHDYTRSL